MSNIDLKKKKITIENDRFSGLFLVDFIDFRMLQALSACPMEQQPFATSANWS